MTFVGGEHLLITRSLLANLSRQTQKLKINRRRTLPASFPLRGCLPQAAWPERLSESQTLWHCSRLAGAWRFTYDWPWYPSGNRPLQQYSALPPGAGYGQSEHKADSLIAKFSKLAERQRLMYEQSHRDYLRSAICIIVCLSWAVNHYRDNAITTKPSATKMPENWLANAAITGYAEMRQRDVVALDAKYTKELADAKAENDALRDDAAAGRRRRYYQSSSPAAWSHHRLRWIMQPLDWQTIAERDYLTP